MPEYIFHCSHCDIHFSHVSSMSEYSKRKYFRCPECQNKADRDFSFDNIQGCVSVSLSDCKTVGHYAEKQSAQYSTQQIEDMVEGFKTQKQGGMGELPSGMTRMEKSPSTTKWNKESSKRRQVNKKKNKGK